MNFFDFEEKLENDTEFVISGIPSFNSTAKLIVEIISFTKMKSKKI